MQRNGQPERGQGMWVWSNSYIIGLQYSTEPTLNEGDLASLNGHKFGPITLILKA